MTIDYVVKKKAIDLHLQGRGRNEIARILNGQKMRISEATITHLIQELKRQCQQQQEQVTTMNEPPLQLSQQGSQSPPQSPQQTFQPELLQEQKAATPQQTSPIQDIDFADNPYPESDVYTDPNADYDEQLDGVKGERRFNYRYTNPYPNTTFPNNFNQQVSRPHVVEEIEENSEELHQSRSSTSDIEVEDSNLGLGIDWDRNHQTRFVKWVMYEKKRRLESERKIQQQWGILVQERNSLEELKRDLEVREKKYSDVKDLIPSARQLKDMGVEFTHAIAWINIIREYALKKMVDERTAVWRLAEDLKNWLELEGFEKAILNAKNQLALLDMALEGQKQAIAIVADLKKSGMTTEDISNLVKTVSKWSDRGQGNVGDFELDAHINLPEGWGDAKN